MPRPTMKTSSQGHVCTRCPNIIVGRAAVCETCRVKEGLCKTCDQPHRGRRTTKYCPPCRAKRRVKKGKFPKYTSAEDQRIREVYGGPAYRGKRDAGGTGAVDRLVQELKRPRWSIKRRALALGVATTRTKEPVWSEAETALLKEFAWMVPEGIFRKFQAAGFHRTATSIAVMRKRLRAREHIDGMSAQGLAGLLGVDGHTALRWIAQGLLAATRSGGKGDNHDAWYVPNESVRRFLREHPEEIDFGKAERAGSKLWLLEMLTGAAVAAPAEAANPEPPAPGVPRSSPPPAPVAPPLVERRVALYGEKVTLGALAQISGRSVAELVERIDDKGMSVNDAAFGPLDANASAFPPNPLALALGGGIRALLKKHRAGPGDLARWTEIPRPLIDGILDGSVPLVAPALALILGALEGELRVASKGST
jgi:hypothetical protein